MQIRCCASKCKETLARQKKTIGLHLGPIVWRRSTTEGSKWLDKRMWAEKWNEISRGTKECGREFNGNLWAEQKRAGGKRPGTNLSNKNMSIVRQRKPQRKTKQIRWRRPGTSARNERKSIRRRKKNRDTEQNKSAGEGLELVLGTKGSQSEDERKTATQNKTNPLEKAWN